MTRGSAINGGSWKRSQNSIKCLWCKLFENGVCRQEASETIAITFTTYIANRMPLSYDNHNALMNGKIIFNNSFILQSL